MIRKHWLKNLSYSNTHDTEIHWLFPFPYHTNVKNNILTTTALNSIGRRYWCGCSFACCVATHFQQLRRQSSMCHITDFHESSILVLLYNHIICSRVTSNIQRKISMERHVLLLIVSLTPNLWECYYVNVAYIYIYIYMKCFVLMSQTIHCCMLVIYAAWHLLFIRRHNAWCGNRITIANVGINGAIRSEHKWLIGIEQHCD